MVKVDVISGFLGAGKTTLIRKLFAGDIRKEKVVLIENEFGEIGIDGSFLKDSGVEIKEINSGCICCSLVGDFALSMKEVIETYHPDRIIIEPSGVGKLSDIVKAINGVEEDLKINILCCVVDAKKVRLQLHNFGEFLRDQIEYAGTIVVGKVDLVEEEKLGECVAAIREINPKANIITTDIRELNSDTLLKALEEKKSFIEDLICKTERECEEDHECCHHHDHDEHECCAHDHDHEEGHHDHEHHHEHEECHHDEHKCCAHDHDHEEGHHDHEHHHEHGHHHADEIFTSWGKETVRAISEENLNEFLEFLKNDETIGTVLRSKGILKGKEGVWHSFDYVAGDYSVRECEADITGRIVVIGSKIDVHRIEKEFEAKAK